MRIDSNSTSVILYFKLQNSSTGAPATGLTITNLTMTYVRDQATPTYSTASALANATAAWTQWSMFEISSTYCPGLYRADFPDAAFATGVPRVQLIITGATIDSATLEVELGYQNVNVSQFGTTTVTARDIGASVLLSPGTGAGQVNLSNGIPQSNVVQILGQNPVNEITSGVIAANITASVSQSTISSGVMAALNTVISASSPSGSINYKLYNLATDTDLITELLNTTLSAYNTVNTVGRALNNIVSGVIATVSSGSIPTAVQIRQEIDSNSTQLSTLASRLSALRATYLDNLASGVVAQDSDLKNLIVNRLTSIRAGYLDNLSAGPVAQQTYEVGLSGLINTTNSRLTSVRAGYLDNLSAGAVAQDSDMSTMLTRLSATRAEYLDNLSSGLIATYSQVANVTSLLSAVKTITDQINFTGTKVNSYDATDSSGVVTLLTRILGTIAAGTHNPQSGDTYPIVNNGTYGNQALYNKLNIESGIVSNIYDVAKKLDTTMQLDGAVYKFTTKALENAPVGSSGTVSFTATDRTNLETVKTVTDILNTMIENVSGQRFKSKALEQAPTSSGSIDTSSLAKESTLNAVNNSVFTISGIVNNTYSNTNTIINNILGTNNSITTVSGIVNTINGNVNTANNSINIINTNLNTTSGIITAIRQDVETNGVKVQDIETGLTFIHAMQGLFALVCKMNGGGTTTVNARNFNDSKNRITWVTDSSNNRLSVTFNFD